MRYAMGQLSIGQILDQSFSLFKNHTKLFLGIAAILYTPVLFIYGLVNMLATPKLSPGATAEETAAAAVESLPYTFGASLVFLVVVFTIIGPLFSAAITYAVGSEYLDKPTTVKEAISAAWSRFGSVLYTGILSGLFILLGFILFIIPGIYLMFKYYLAMPVVVLEDVKGRAALKRSGFLMKGNMGIAFVLGILLMVLSLAATFVSSLIPIPFVTLVIDTIVQTCVVTITYVAGVVLYFHARSKHENYDLQMLAESVGADEPFDSQGPPPLPSMQ